jgi:hypothetical protein
LGRFLENRQRVSVLIDNLDKAWERASDFDELAAFLLGLLTAASSLTADFRRRDAWRTPVSFNVAVFIRSDIYQQVEMRAREPDKLPVTRLLWNDPDQLLRVVEERYEAARQRPGSGSEMWTRFFCARVRGQRTRDYLAWRVLPRPRDLVYLCNAAITAAVNRGNERIEVADIEEAEQLYSNFALDVLRVEGLALMCELDDVLLEFLEAPATMSVREAEKRIARVSGMGSSAGEAVETLVQLSFLGWELGDGRLEFATETRDDAKARRLAASRKGGPRVGIHPAFRPYLEISDAA